MPPGVLAGALVALALFYVFLNGKNDSANTVATMIASHAMTPRRALTFCAFCEFIGPFLFGVSVASTVGNDVVAGDTITISVTLAALASAIIWNLISMALGIPSSASHALIGGLVGAAAWGYGYGVILPAGLLKVILYLFLSPVVGLVAGYLMVQVVFFLARGASPKINISLRRAQWVAAAGLALSHGSNDAQKAMGVITMGLLALGLLPSFQVPFWVIFLTAAAMGIGTYSAGWKVIRTLGGRFFKVRPVHAFSSQLSSAGIVLGAALLGGPVSATHVVSASILGVGSGQRVSQVRWRVARDIVLAWILTIPATAILSTLLYIPLSTLID